MVDPNRWKCRSFEYGHGPRQLDFYSKTLRGAIVQEPLEKRSIRTVNWTLGEALGNSMWPKNSRQKPKHK